MELQRLLKMRGAGFFFAFENEFEIDGERNIFGAESVERGENRHDGRLVIGRRAGVDAPVVLVRSGARCRRQEGNGFAAGLDGVVAQHGFEGRLVGPGGRIDWLAVVVGVENHRSAGVFGVSAFRRPPARVLRSTADGFRCRGLRAFL